jgi:aminoglycoside phosphotransferase (APT) family kinase protein
LFRIGGKLLARFPLEPRDVESARRWLQSEAQAARELLGRTRFPTPEPVALGEPGAGYPLPWSVQTWLPGTVATDEDPGESVAFAHDLAEFIHGVRAIDTCGRAFRGRGRGGDLRSHDAWMEKCFERSEHLLDVPRLRRAWAVMRVLPRTARDVMTHGDLIPGNVLVSDGRLAGIIDVGGMGPADPALDLVGAWHLLEVGPRQVFRDDLECGDLEWERGKAWAFEQSMGAVWYYVESNPAMSLMGRRTLHRIMADGPPS